MILSMFSHEFLAILVVCTLGGWGTSGAGTVGHGLCMRHEPLPGDPGLRPTFHKGTGKVLKLACLQLGSATVYYRAH